jgi:hypothetical protein
MNSMNAMTLTQAIRARLSSGVKLRPLVLKPILTLAPDQTRIIRPRGLMTLLSILLSTLLLSHAAVGASIPTGSLHETTATAPTSERTPSSC